MATAIKLANPDLKVICCSGDGDSLAEGLDHLMFAAKRNIDITLILHDNRVYGLTTGQYTPTSPMGFKGKSTPLGTHGSDKPCRADACRRCFLHRQGLHPRNRSPPEIVQGGYNAQGILLCGRPAGMCHILQHVRVLQQTRLRGKGQRYRQLRRCHEDDKTWNYGEEAPIPLGTFYQVEAPRFDDAFPGYEPHKVDRDAQIKKVLENFI